MTSIPRLSKFVSILIVAILLTACTGNPKDPFEGYNRTMFHFNDAVDTVVVKPVASAYSDLLPDFVQTAVGNFFGNLGDIWTAFNHILQGEGEKGMSDVARVLLNSSFGLGGLIDIASDAGIPKHRSDFGVTLGVWGIESGPYVVLPLAGPSTVRDTIALPADWYGDVWTYVRPVSTRNAGIGLRIVSNRAALLDTVTLLEDASLDKYEFVRDAFLQRRESLINRAERKSEDDWEDAKKSSPAEQLNQPEQTKPASVKTPVSQNQEDKQAAENLQTSENEQESDDAPPQAQLNASSDTQLN